MERKIPRILSVGVGEELQPGIRSIMVGWGDAFAKKSAVVDLSGWIRTGGPVLAPLQDFALFGTARVSEFCDAVVWGDEDGDLAIDAVHLLKLGEEQAAFTTQELLDWQAGARLSNAEASQVFGVVPSTWARYKTGENIPESVAIAVRAAKRDPLILQARLRPATPAGRPRGTRKITSH